MKRDARTLDHTMLEAIHEMAVQRVREDERHRDVLARFGTHRCTIYGWLKATRADRGSRVSAWKDG
jgi:transposase